MQDDRDHPTVTQSGNCQKIEAIRKQDHSNTAAKSSEIVRLENPSTRLALEALCLYGVGEECPDHSTID